jgi:hypothetical protein
MAPSPRWSCATASTFEATAARQSAWAGSAAAARAMKSVASAIVRAWRASSPGVQPLPQPPVSDHWPQNVPHGAGLAAMLSSTASPAWRARASPVRRPWACMAAAVGTPLSQATCIARRSPGASPGASPSERSNAAVSLMTARAGS